MATSQAESSEPSFDPQADSEETTSESSSALHLVIGGIVAFVVIVAVLLDVFASAKSKVLQPGEPVPHAASTSALLSGIPQEGLALGSDRAPVTLTEFCDLQSPVCAVFARQVLPKLISGPVRSEYLQIVFHPVDTVGAGSVSAAQMALALGEQDKAWQFIDLMYRNQPEQASGYVTTSYLKAVAAGVKGANVGKALTARLSTVVNAQIAKSSAEASRRHMSTLPGFLIQRRGRPPRRFEPSSVLDSASFIAPIEAMRRGG